MATDPTTPKKRLVLHIEVPDVWADDLDEAAGIWAEGEPTDRDRLGVVLQEWFWEKVGLTLVTLPGDKCMNDDFDVITREGCIVGAEARDA